MCAHRRAAVLLAAAEWLACEGHAGRPYSVTIAHEEATVTWPVPHWGAPPKPPPESPPPGYRRLSPLEERIVAAADPAEYRSSERLAELCGVKCSDGFKAILTNLADADVIEPLSGKGYRLSPGWTQARSAVGQA